MNISSFPALILMLAISSTLNAEQPPTPEPLIPKLAPASKEGQRALSAFKIPAGLKGELFAAEPMVANPVAIDVDDQGRVFVCETYRQKKAIEDNRDHGHWLDDDLAAQTVEDRLAYIKRHLGDAANEYMLHDDRIRLLVDSDQDGRADESTVFASHFNGILDGTGAGVLHHQGNVYYTCIPHLWQLKDTNGDGQANNRTSLHRGYGVRFAFRGHDMHGLAIGPDGKIYYSIGDRGYNVKVGDKRFADPESGAVFRCNPDGSELEVFYTGLRNPQELAFDDYGNLFTVDNNSDSGDKARLVYLVEGGESGWRMAFQYLSDRGPWNREKLWHPWHDGQAAYINPPIANISDGPSGLTYYPGTGFGDDFKNRFFLCDFRGASAQSGIRSFRVKPKGAFFEITDEQQPFWNILPTDLDFGPDGGLYVSDWVHGWDGLGKGRIYRFFDPTQVGNPIVKQVRELLVSDLTSAKSETLAKLLAHADRRVRLKAQFALVEKRDFETLFAVAKSSERQLSRIHGLWGIGQLGRRHPQIVPFVGGRIEQGREAGKSFAITKDFVKLLKDDDPEVVAQAAKLIGEIPLKFLAPRLTILLDHESSRVRYCAASGIGKIGDPRPLLSIFQMLDDNGDRDPVVRHGGVMALVGMENSWDLADAADGESSHVRLGVILALRRRRSSKIVKFLSDKEESLVVEAARAIHDVPILDAMPGLADLITTKFNDDALLRRVLNANYRLGEAKHAKRLAEFAARDGMSESLRIEALEMLTSWENPSPKDRVLGMWRPLEKRNESPARAAIESQFDSLARTSSRPVRIAAVNIAAQFGIQDAGSHLVAMFKSRDTPPSDRANALLLLSELEDEIPQVIESALGDSEALVRSVARRVLAKSNPARAVASLEKASIEGELVERQGALSTLAQLSHPSAAKVLSRMLDRLLAGKIPADTTLDVLDAAAKKSTNDIKMRLERYESMRATDDHLSAFRESLHGGNAERGRQIFFDRRDVSCRRCHKINQDGGDVGPDLSKIGLDKKRDYLLESLVQPSRAMAKGFESVLVITIDGRIHAGILKHEDDKVIRLMTATGETFEIDKATIDERTEGKSAMPEDLAKQLSKSDLRDLIEYLCSLK